MNTTSVSKPCPTCPFRRDVKPGELGGSPIGMFIGQVNGPFWLPCQTCTNYDDPNWKSDYSKPQCAGAATFRSNMGWRGSPSLALLPPDRTLVFGNFAEFVAHHCEMGIGDALYALALTKPDELTRAELKKAACKIHLTPKQ